ncbi:hypothetical protein CISIN_1g014066mg [Citrus sinensis]|uniref:Ribosomal protein L1 n=1 Tax=Citrus sinensis TaxID=2711 RepID=A0A067FBT8_CITSI|nr:hypothetical protein CISIN_1g014066mg [Citrus sinensis]
MVTTVAPPLSLPPSAGSRVSPKTVERAVKALLKWLKSNSQTQKPQLLEQDDFVYLILTLKKIPQVSRTNAFKIPLPHSLLGNDSDNPPEICLIMDDRPKSNLTKDAVMKKIKNDNLPITKVIKITKLKTDYRPFEAKRKLCDSYDIFLADKRVVPLLPKLLGKHFFKKKKIPVPVDLKHQNWKEQIEKVCGSALLYLRTGTCSVLKVGKVSMGAEDIAENVIAAINGLLESLALPVYQAVPDLKLKIEGVKENEGEGQDKDSEKENAEDVNDHGSKKKLKKKKGRIHEVRYMDSTIGEVLDEDELGSDDDGEGDVGESEDGEDSEDGKMSSGDILGKKRKKGDKERAQKLPKKVAKVKKDELSSDMKNEDVGKQKKQKKVGLSLKNDEEKSSGKEKKKSMLGKVKKEKKKLVA